MKCSAASLTVFLVFLLSLGFAVSCGFSGDDDDSGTGDDTLAEDDTAAADDDIDDDADDDVDDDVDDDNVDDDTTADDDTVVDDDTSADDDITDDDATDDDTIPLGIAPTLKLPKFVISAADPDLEYWDEWGTGTTHAGTFDPVWERTAWWAGWRDVDGNLGGGLIHTQLDGADPTTSPLPATLGINGTWDQRKVGIEFTGDFAAPGAHSVVFWVTDANGLESNHFTITYSVGTTARGIGTDFTDFTLRGFQKSVIDATGAYQNYHLSDYLGKVVVIDSFAGWCPPCNSEAPQLDQIHETYPDTVQIFSLMMEDFNSNTVTDAVLENWTLYNYGDSSEGARAGGQLTGVILNDDNATVAGPYWLANYVPDNFVLDKDHVVRFKMSGFSKSTITNAIDELLAE